MYERIVWKDEVRNPDKTFSYTDNGDGTMTFARAGTQVQEGTNQNAVHLNQMDAGIEAANVAAHLLYSFVSTKLGFSEHTLDGLDAVLHEEIATDQAAAAILYEVIQCTTQAYQRDLDARISVIEAGLA